MSLRKAFVGVLTDSVDSYYGAHAIVADAPADPRVSVVLFTTKSWTDRRSAAKDRVERYLARGVKWSGVNADARLKTLCLKPRYPSLPWQWATATPDRALPLDIVKTLDPRWTQKPDFNAVMVSGERHGLSARVYRSGTSGEQMASSVVDALLTHADACRERGRSTPAGRPWSPWSCRCSMRWA